jgi:hypothetical protein
LHEIPRACNDARGRRKRNDSNGDTCDDKSTDATIVVVIANLALVANVHKASPSRRDALVELPESRTLASSSFASRLKVRRRHNETARPRVTPQASQGAG